MKSGISNRGRRAAFTFIELLVVVGVICILLAIMLQSIRAAGIQAARTMDVRNNGQCALACNIYATDNNNWYPVGYWRGGGTYSGGHDHLTTMWGGSWQLLRDEYGLTTEMAYCYNAYDDEHFRGILDGVQYDGGESDAIGNMEAETIGVRVIPGRVYWGGRRCPPVCDFTDWCTGDPVVQYKSPVQTTSTVTSATLWACYTNAPAKAKWSATWGNQIFSWKPKVPHGLGTDKMVCLSDQNMLGEWNCRADLLPPFEGLTCSYTDGSARWVLHKNLAWAGCEYCACFYDGTK